MASLRKVREYLKATGAVEMQSKVIEQLLSGMIKSSERFEKIEGEKMVKFIMAMNRKVTRKVVKLMKDFFRVHLTTKEINYLIAVQNHPTTIKLRELSPQLTTEMVPGMMKIVKEEADNFAEKMDKMYGIKRRRSTISVRVRR
jgi:hypothetical protein